MDYENKTKEELIELLEGKQDTIYQLEQKAEDAQGDMEDYRNEAEEAIESSFDIQQQEELAQKSFYAGRDSNLNLTPLKAFLDFKLEYGL